MTVFGMDLHLFISSKKLYNCNFLYAASEIRLPLVFPLFAIFVILFLFVKCWISVAQVMHK